MVPRDKQPGDIAMGFCGEHGEVSTKCKINCKDITDIKESRKEEHTDMWKEINTLKQAIIGKGIFFAVVSLLGSLLCAVLGSNYFMNERLLNVVVPIHTQVAVIESEIINIKGLIDKTSRSTDD